MIDQVTLAPSGLVWLVADEVVVADPEQEPAEAVAGPEIAHARRERARFTAWLSERAGREPAFDAPAPDPQPVPARRHRAPAGMSAAVAEILCAAREPLPVPLVWGERWCSNCGESLGPRGRSCLRCGSRQLINPRSLPGLSWVDA